jgi:hypothetical protein
MSRQFPFDPPPPPQLVGRRPTWIVIVAILSLIAGFAFLAAYVRDLTVEPPPTAGTGRTTQVGTAGWHSEILLTDNPFPEHHSDLGVEQFEFKLWT